MTLAAVNRRVPDRPPSRATAKAIERLSRRIKRRNPYLRATINPAMIPDAANVPKHPDCRFTDGSHARV
jgi:hypothetical protein